jgi:chromosome segregation protein
MLKALELVGFKSFADKTHFEFPPGITVVVGPNGSGKSNIVDAIKWVLGEQSVKSLRGKEMADCIFNGSATRRALNAAETTLTFDNSKRVLGLDAPEVHITRRVYRSGEGEYLINRQPCRLRDIRDLFAGTGVATEAYSVIEQGKVDILLQSSPRDRRLIFEEAAGISRFKAKKLESLRRLERVDQNLLRLSDIVDEVDSRLRAVRLQAGKARKYKEYSDRLQTLRTQIALVDWRHLSEKLSGLEAELTSARQESAQLLAQVESLEGRSAALETQIAAADAAARASDSRVAKNREQIAARDSASEHGRRRARDLEEETGRLRRQLAAMGVRSEDVEQQLRNIAENLVAAEQSHREVARRLAEEERSLTKLTGQADELRAENERRRAVHLEKMRTSSTLASQISALESTVAALGNACDRNARRQAELAASRETLSAEAESLGQEVTALDEAASELIRQLEAVQATLAENRRRSREWHQTLAQLRQRHAGASERLSVLDELEKRLEGLSAGVKQMLTQARSAAPGPLAHVRGLVADLLQVNFETAPLVEVALGELAHALVVTDGRDLVAYLEGSPALAGRVGFVRLDLAPQRTHLDQLDLRGRAGVLGRADEFVETTPEFAVLAKRLLGRTWIVETLSQALALAESTGRGLSFVSRDCQLVAADGTLYCGPRQASSGLISRRAELRSLKHQIAEAATQIEARQADSARLDEEIAAQDRESQALSAELKRATDALNRRRLVASATVERLAQIEKQHAAVNAELASAQQEHQQASAALAESLGRRQEIESRLAELEVRLSESGQHAAELEQTRAKFVREVGGTKIEVVKCEQRLAHLTAQKSQLERDQQERSRTLSENRAQMAAASAKLLATERDILAAESELAELYLDKERLAAEAVGHFQRREEWRQQKAHFALDVSRIRGKLRKLETRVHDKELVASQLSHERGTLADRLREDYGIELAELEHQPTPEELHQRDEVEREIADLRSKLNSIGGVNLDALAELDELEARYANLSSQHQDLSSAKASLEQIIGKINADSRRLFADTLEVVRGHFQSLFRKLFGGGHADIVLDEGVDILDSGIEIVARPPGKEPRNISLLSGGEKTLTCVALLLAIFRSRPSPFCVLDEVDAALDEANIERFIGVLQEFLAWTQFIVVTHSKKTMTCASTLYGITMQESGVSKRVSVRFEDVSDDGEILNVPAEPPVGPSPTGNPGQTGDETQAA